MLDPMTDEWMDVAENYWEDLRPEDREIVLHSIGEDWEWALNLFARLPKRIVDEIVELLIENREAI